MKVFALFFDIIYYVLTILFILFLAGIVLAFSSIFGLIIGAFLQSTAGKWAFWPGFVLGVIIFIIYLYEYIFGDDKTKKSPSSFVLNRRIKFVKYYFNKKWSSKLYVIAQMCNRFLWKHSKAGYLLLPPL